MRTTGNSLTTRGVRMTVPVVEPIAAASGEPDDLPRRSWFGRLLQRREVTTYQRCLAVHIHSSGPHSALS